MNDSAARRQLGTSDLQVSAVGLGCWPISGVSSLGVTDQQSLATIHAALEAGINFFDTAYSYGYDGEADRLLATVLAGRRGDVVLASKVGIYFDAARQRVVDGTPETILEHSRTVLRRLRVEQIDLMYLHQPDPRVPIEESAGAMAEVVRCGWARYAAVSNVDAQQLSRFQSECPVVAVQPPFNMLQQQSVEKIRETCLQQQIGIACYWVLMKGLLAGKLARDHQFHPQDRRLTYEIYQGQAWQRSQDLLDKLRELAGELGCTVAQLVIAWTLHQPGISVALCGAKRPEQIEETAAAMPIRLDEKQLASIDRWLEDLRSP